MALLNRKKFGQGIVHFFKNAALIILAAGVITPLVSRKGDVILLAVSVSVTLISVFIAMIFRDSSGQEENE